MISANDFRRQWEDAGADVLAAVRRVGESGWYILGPEVKAFEAALARTWGLPHAVGVASGLDAIEIGLRALGCRGGDRVATTPISAFATTLAIVKLGATPVFVDCDDNGLMRLDLAAKTGARFVVPVHLYGFSLDLDELTHLRDRYELRVVEDCAQSILAHWNGRPTGTAGQFAATSFYPTKNLGAMGDGGALLTADAALAAEAAMWRDYGQSGKYRHDKPGYNSRLDELHAAILRDAFLPRLKTWTARRREIAALYREGIRNPAIRVPNAGQGSNGHLFPVFVDPGRKESFLAHLRERGITPGEHYPACLFEQKALEGLPVEMASDCANAVRLCRSEVSLPIHPYLTNDQAASVLEACNNWAP